MRTLRRDLGWSQTELGQRAGGRDRSFLAEVESGKVSPGMDYLWALADALGVELADLLSDSSRQSGRNAG